MRDWEKDARTTRILDIDTRLHPAVKDSCKLNERD